MTRPIQNWEEKWGRSAQMNKMAVSHQQVKRKDMEKAFQVPQFQIRHNTLSRTVCQIDLESDMCSSSSSWLKLEVKTGDKAVHKI